MEVSLINANYIDAIPESKSTLYLDVCPENLYQIEVDKNIYILIIDNNMPPPQNQTLFISNGDIIDNKIVRNHNLNTNSLDCSLFDENGYEISVGFRIIDSSTIELDMTRISIPLGINWKVFLEV